MSTQNIKKNSALSFESFLQNYCLPKDCKEGITHTRYGSSTGKYKIPDNKMDTFHRLYAKEVKNKKKLNLIERHNDYCCILVDFDFKFDLDVTERRYTEEHVKKIVNLYMEEIDDSFNTDDKMNDIMAFVFQRKEPYQSKGVTKDGLHIMFPFIVSEPHIQYIIRDNIIKKLEETKILEDLGLKNSISEVVDKSVIYNNGWFMFGSSKPDLEPYELKYIYDYSLSLLNPSEVNYRGIKDIPTFFSIRRFTEQDCTMIKSTKIPEVEKRIEKQSTMVLNRMKKYHTTKYDIQQISQLLNIFSDKRATDHKKWMKVGWCLYNINCNDIELFNLWKEFTMNKYPKFKQGLSKRSCEKEWNLMRGFALNGNRLSQGSLHYWAKKDNSSEYQKIKKKDIQYYIEKSTSCTNYDIARVLYEMYKYQFVCASVKSQTWYEFRDHRWREDDGAINLRKLISTELLKEYTRLISEYNQKFAKSDMDPTLSTEEKQKAKKDFDDATKPLHHITMKLKTTSFKDNIMRECRELFYDREFLNKLDENAYLIGFENGVYDLRNSEFRDGEPEDYISRTTGNDYVEYNGEDIQVFEIDQFLNQVMPNYNVKKYVMKLLASILQGFNAEEKFRIWTGTGGKLLPLSISFKNIGKSFSYRATLSNCWKLLIIIVTTFI